MARPAPESVLTIATRHLPVLTALIVLAPVQAAAACSSNGRFRFDGDGVWPFYLNVDAGRPCTRTFTSRGATVFRRLNLMEPPRHGRISLREGGYYTYVPDAGYAGPDGLVLQVCGATSGHEGCATLKVEVTVR